MGAKGGDKMPEVFLVNWFRRGDDGRFLWPGFGENSRVLKWVVDRIEGNVEADETVVGYIARYEDIDTEGLTEPEEDIRETLTVRPEEWSRDVESNEEWLKFLGPKVPSEVWDQHEALKQRIADAK